MKKKLLFVNAWFIAYAGFEVFYVVRWGFYWWEPLFWALVGLTAFCCNRVFVRMYRESADLSGTTLPETATWLRDSARWPEPWTHHDLDYPEAKVLPWQ